MSTTSSSSTAPARLEMLLTASVWEYRWKFLILMASQPVYALLVFLVSANDGPWYAPTFTFAQALTGSLLAVFGAGLRVAGTSELTVAVMSSEDPDSDSLVTSGPFAAVRNPLYAGTICLFTGYAILFHWIGAIVFFAFHMWRYDRVVRLEESGLSESWKADFDVYAQRAGRWLPRPAGLIRVGIPRATIAAILSNAGFVGLGIGVVVSAATGNLVWVIPFEVAGFGIFAIYHLTRGRGRSGASS